MQIQRAAPEDAHELLTLQRLAYQSEAAIYGLYDIPPLTQTLAEMEADLERQTVLKAVLDGQIVGSVRAYAQGGACHIGRLIVHPDHQDRGLGTRLMRAIEGAFAGECARFELFTGHKSARNLYLYHKLGYTEFKRETVNGQLAIVFLEKARSVTP
jgi:ribosomal protein S18 acetylase RimI-like enzyme